MLRTIWFYLLFIPASALCSFMVVVSRTRFGAKRWERRWARSAVFAAGLTIEADLSAMDPDTSYVVMANHQSNLDIPVLIATLPDRALGFVAKQSLFEIPLFGRAMRVSGHVPIDRDNPRRAMKSMDAAATAAAEGVTVVIFPEGTRGTTLEALQDFHIGGMIMALKCGLPVAPLVLSGTASAVPKGSGLIRKARVRIRALAPVDTASRYTLKQREQFRLDLYAAMEAAYQELCRE